MTRPCPHCAATAGALERIITELVELRASLHDDNPAVAEPMLEACEIAFEIKRSDSQARRLCRKAEQLGLPGVEWDGTRWRATLSAIRTAQAARM